MKLLLQIAFNFEFHMVKIIFTNKHGNEDDYGEIVRILSKDKYVHIDVNS